MCNCEIAKMSDYNIKQEIKIKREVLEDDFCQSQLHWQWETKYMFTDLNCLNKSMLFTILIV